MFRPDGSITAGNASPLNDGASSLLLGSEAVGARTGLQPQARIAGRGAFALAPQEFGYAPVEAANRALARAGIGWSDVGAVELNEAFAVQSLACLDGWGVDPEIVNTRGGAIAHRPPARRLRRPHPGHPGEGAPRARRPLGRGRDLHRRRPGPGRRPRERPRGGLSR